MNTFLFVPILAVSALAFSAPNVNVRQSSALWSSSQDSFSGPNDTIRRNMLTAVPAAFLTSQFLPVDPALAFKATGASDGNLPDFPPEAIRSYLQYRIPLQIAADFYIFDLQKRVGDVDEWDQVQQLYRGSQARGGQGQPSKLERDFVNPMRIVLLSLPPDYADDMRAAQFRFEKAMNDVSKATLGYRKDLPVEIPATAVADATKGWEEGRLALNDFLDLLNKATGLSELRTIPPPGPNQRDQYGRSKLKYNDLVKKTKLCQNRGGPALSQGWGMLMVSGYMQDSCGIPDLEEYFYQT